MIMQRLNTFFSEKFHKYQVNGVLPYERINILRRSCCVFILEPFQHSPSTLFPP